jgi:hypothetical protein
VRTRRRPLLVGLGVALTALGGLGAAWLASSGTGTVSVVGVRHEIRAGQAIQRGDLMSVQVAVGGSLHVLPVQSAETVIGKRSLVRLLPGSLVNPDAVVDRLVPGPGQALVGLSVGPAQRPAVPLNAGDPVRIVYTPATGGSAAQALDQTAGDGGTRSSVPAVVVDTVEDGNANRTIVDVTLPQAAAAEVAAWSSAGHASFVLLAGDQG